MSPSRDDKRAEAMQALAAAERARLAAVRDLIELRVIRSRNLVRDLGEELAARFYGVPLERPSTPGFDLRRRDQQRVQVRALRCTSDRVRKRIGAMKEPYDLLHAIRLNEDYTPREAIEVPRDTVVRVFADGPVIWTKALEHDPSVSRFTADELLAGPQPVRRVDHDDLLAGQERGGD